MKKLMIFIIIVIIVVIAIIFGVKYFLGSSNSSEDVGRMKDGDVLVLKDVSGKKVYKLKRENNGFVLLNHPNKMVMLDFFATYCPPCRVEAPILTKIQGNNKNLIIIGLDFFENVKDKYIVDEYVNRVGAYYFITNQGYDKSKRLMNTILHDIHYYRKDTGIPFKVVLYRGKYRKVTNREEGKMTYYYLGAVNEKDVNSDLARINKEK